LYGCSSKLAWKKCTTYVAKWVQAGHRCGVACIGTASRAAAIVRHYGHFQRPDGFGFSQRSPADAWMLAAPTTCICAAARSPHGTTSDCPIPQSSSAEKKVVKHREFSEKLGILEKHHVSNDATENAWFLSNLICLPGNSP
jgi:hypothetical protein